MEGTEIKRLPRNEDGSFARHFTASGLKNTIRTFEEGISIERYTIFEKLSIGTGFGKSFQALFECFRKAKQYCNDIPKGKAEFTDLAYFLQSVEEGILEKSEERYNMAFYMCSLFIVEEGEDLVNWSSAEAEAKIDRWKKEGYDARDFLELALSGVQGFFSAYQETTQRILRRTEFTENISRTPTDGTI